MSGPSEAQTIATLRDGEAVDAVFACTRKQRLLTRAGDPYLTLDLRDASGTLTARAFRDVDLLAGAFERGDLVRARGRTERFRGELQLALEKVERVELGAREAARFLPVSRRDLDELEGFFEHLAREVYDPPLRALLEAILADRGLRAELRRAPCSLPPGSGPGGSGAHHAFLGGLLEHTVAVAQLALELCAVHPRLDRDLLLCAALVHDVGKTREYVYGAEIALSEEGRMLGHVELGLRTIAAHAPASLTAERRLALEHCVLSHHGEHAGAQRPASAEALALQRLNALDAAVKGAFERGL
jgi:3'-5' exoribonuclease